MTCMPETHPCPCTLISVLWSGWFDSCDMALHGISTLMPANFSRVPVSVRACGRQLSSGCQMPAWLGSHLFPCPPMHLFFFLFVKSIFAGSSNGFLFF